MTHKETVERNIGLTFDFVNHLIDNEIEVEKLPETFNLKFIEKDFSKHQNQQQENCRTAPLQEQYVRVRNTFSMV